MNLENIKAIVNSGLPNWERLLIYELSKDKDAIPIMMEILHAERKEKEELIIDLNALLSKAHVGLETPKFNKNGFMQKEIKEFYKSGRINHCFANMD